MKLAYCSDLHLEFATLDFQNDQDADVLVLAGDIFVAAYLNHPSVGVEFDLFLRRCSERFEHVVYVAGNHEFYDSGFLNTRATLVNFVSQYSNVYYLEKDFIELEGYTFVGATLWTDMNKGDPSTKWHLSRAMSDFSVIDFGKFTVDHAETQHDLTMDYFRYVISTTSTDKFVVVSHHAPTFVSVHEMYRQDRLMNGGYASDLSDFILDRPSIKLWVHGHMHTPSDYMMGETRVVANPRGYKGREKCADYFQLKYVTLE
jgi:Icc-related predicted phosphoesterase